MSANKLSALSVNKATKAGLYGDGAGLWLQITKTGGKSWLFRYMQQGKAHEMGLGAVNTISLAEAREKARACRQMLMEGKNPLLEKQRMKREQLLAQASHMTFAECATQYIANHKAGWKNAKHLSQWEATLSTYAFPVMGELSVADIDTALVLKSLEPIWTTKTETATRLRSRIELILDWARVRGFRNGENPARWRGHLDKILPKPSKVAKKEHHAALPYAEIQCFMAELKQREGITVRALEFAILTAARTGEVRGATWDEIDMKQAMWIIPAARMKAGNEHRVPLSSHAMQILKEMHATKQSTFIFPSVKAGKPLSDMAMIMILRRMGLEAVTHGFRSTFRDWAAEMTSYPSEVAEMALAHVVSNKVEAAYRRGDLLAKRHRLMQDWADYCYSPIVNDSHKVVGIRG